MKKSHILPVIVVLLMMQLRSYPQQISDNKREINSVLKTYMRSIIERDSSAFYSLFNDGPVEWAAAVKDRSQTKLNEKSPQSKFLGRWKNDQLGLQIPGVDQDRREMEDYKRHFFIGTYGLF